jgi:hypothetical protein
VQYIFGIQKDFNPSDIQRLHFYCPGLQSGVSISIRARSDPDEKRPPASYSGNEPQ